MQLHNVDLEGMRNAYKKTQDDVAAYLKISSSGYRNKEKGKNELLFSEAVDLSSLYDCELTDVYDAYMLSVKNNRTRRKKK